MRSYTLSKECCIIDSVYGNRSERFLAIFTIELWTASTRFFLDCLCLFDVFDETTYLFEVRESGKEWGRANLDNSFALKTPVVCSTSTFAFTGIPLSQSSSSIIYRTSRWLKDTSSWNRDARPKNRFRSCIACASRVVTGYHLHSCFPINTWAWAGRRGSSKN